MTRWWSFVPYVVIGAVHLVALFVGADVVSGPTKGLLMPALLLGLLLALPSLRTEIALWATIGILFSWLGDILLSSPGDFGFILGLGGFLIAHAVYLVMFLRPLRTRRVPWFALLYIPWWLVLVVVLAPHLGGLLVPVALYGLILGASAATALGTNRWTALGGLLFALSDSVLAYKLFYPGFALWEADFLIMLGYIAGQGLIIAGAVRFAQRTIARDGGTR